MEYPQEFLDQMKDFKARYGFEFWYPKAGYWSQEWLDVFNYLNGNLPVLLKNADYSMEGSGITSDGFELIASGIVLPDGGRPIVAVDARMQLFMSNILNGTSNMIIGLANLASQMPRASQTFLKVHDDIAQIYNQVAQQFADAQSRAMANNIPLVADVYGENAPQLIASLPVYVVMDASTLERFANLVLTVTKINDDAKKTLETGTPQGVMKEYLKFIEPEPYTPKEERKEKTKDMGMYIFIGSILIVAVGMVIATVKARRE